MIPEDKYEFCSFLDKYLEGIDKELSSGKGNPQAIQNNLQWVRGKLEEIGAHAKQLRQQNKDVRNLSGRVIRVFENLELIEGLANMLAEPSALQIPDNSTNQQIPLRQNTPITVYDDAVKFITDLSKSNELNSLLKNEKLSMEDFISQFNLLKHLQAKIQNCKEFIINSAPNKLNSLEIQGILTTATQVFSKIDIRLRSLKTSNEYKLFDINNRLDELIEAENANRKKINELYSGYSTVDIKQELKEYKSIQNSIENDIKNLNREYRETLSLFQENDKKSSEGIVLKSPAIITTHDIRPLLHPGKEITKVGDFREWLENEYSNKQSPTYKAYQSIAKSQNLDTALFIGIRGSGNCGYGAMLVSLLLELASDPQCQNKFNTLMQRLDKVVQDCQDQIPGFNKLDKTCLVELRNCKGNPELLIKLLNNDAHINNLICLFRFLSNAIGARQYRQLPQEDKWLVEEGPFNEGVRNSKGVIPFFTAHAAIDVENPPPKIPAYLLFADGTHLTMLAQELGIGYRMEKVDEKIGAQEAHLFPYPDSKNKEYFEPLLTLNLVHRGFTHYDVIHQDKKASKK